MRLAAIDIGSNGARLLIKNFRTASDGSQQISRVMYMRVPLRLGSDVYARQDFEGAYAYDETHAQGL